MGIVTSQASQFLNLSGWAPDSILNSSNKVSRQILPYMEAHQQILWITKITNPTKLKKVEGTRFSFLRTAMTPFRMPDLNSSGMPDIDWTGVLKDQNDLECNSLKTVLLHLFSWKHNQETDIYSQLWKLGDLRQQTGDVLGQAQVKLEVIVQVEPELHL